VFEKRGQKIKFQGGIRAFKINAIKRERGNGKWEARHQKVEPGCSNCPLKTYNWEGGKTKRVKAMPGRKREKWLKVGGFGKLASFSARKQEGEN